MNTLFTVEELKKENKTLYDLIHKPRFTLKENKKIRNYSVKVFILNNKIIFKFKEDDEISGTVDELKKNI